MATKISVDKAGRVVLPKPVRDRMRLAAGDELELESEGERITLRPMRAKAMLRKECGIWVYQGGPADNSIPELVEQEREKRLREFEE